MGRLTINQWMGLKEMKGKELAEKTGLTEATISKIRNGSKPTIDSLKKIAEALDIEVGDIEI